MTKEEQYAEWVAQFPNTELTFEQWLICNIEAWEVMEHIRNGGSLTEKITTVSNPLKVLLEQRLLLSSEAEKGERLNFFCSEYDKVGHTCEVQCDGCYKAENIYNVPAKPRLLSSPQEKQGVEECQHGYAVGSQGWKCVKCGKEEPLIERPKDCFTYSAPAMKARCSCPKMALA